MSVKTSNRPPLFDPGLLAQRRDRAVGSGFVGRGDFIHREVAGLLSERLAEVNRPFRDVTIIGSGGGLHAEALRAVLPQAAFREIEISPLRSALSDARPVQSLDPMDLLPGESDLVISCLEMHWQNDPVGHLIQLRRALRPDGLAVAVLFGGQTLSELRAALGQAEVETTGGLSPRIAPMGELRDLGALLQRAGLTMPVADVERLHVTYSDAVALMHDLRAMGETNILTERRRVPMRRSTLRRCAEIYAEIAPAPGGRITATFELMFLTGWAPAVDQPKSLRPGTARTRLADALGTIEQTAGEKASPSDG